MYLHKLHAIQMTIHRQKDPCQKSVSLTWNLETRWEREHSVLSTEDTGSPETWMWQSKECLEKSTKQRLNIIIVCLLIPDCMWTFHSQFFSIQIEILNKLKHPCIIQFHGVTTDRPGPPEHYIITGIMARFLTHCKYPITLRKLGSL